MADTAKLLISIGALLILIGAGMYFIGKVPGIGKLPGDIFIKKDNFSFYFPVTTSIILSIFLSLLMLFLNRK